MKDAVRQTRSYLMQLFEQHGFHPRTDLGQNFLIDLNIIEFIVEEAKLTEHDVVLEVGAGTGGMTTFMATQAAHVISVEVDPNMYKLAQYTTAEYDNVTLINQDALRNKNNFSPQVLEEIDKQLAVDSKRRLKLVANLPYHVATPVVSNLMASNYEWERMVITIQLELGQRMQARPKNSNYGALSVWLQSQAFVKLLKRLPPSVFWPRPGVNSAVVRLAPNPQGKSKILNRPFLQDFLRRLFHQRRKMMRSVLVGMYRKQMSKPDMDAILDELGFDQTTRAETLNSVQLTELANAIYRQLGEQSDVDLNQGIE